MARRNSSTTLIAATILGVALLFATTHDAFAHQNWSFKAGGNANNTVKITVGSTHEPTYTNEEHNLEITVQHVLTSIPVGNWNKAQTSAGTSQIFIDRWFYPQSTLTGADLHVPALSGCTNPVANSPANCGPGAGYTDSDLRMSVSTISTAFPDNGQPGQYRQSLRQLLTADGRTLYHVYGEMNIFNDTAVGTIPFNYWTDGSAQNSGIARVSVCEGLVGNKAACKSGDTTYNKTLTINSSFSPQNVTSDSFWPNNVASGVTENAYPPNERRALGSVQDNTFDIWNVLEKISNAINSIPGLGTLVPDYVPRNSTNSNAPTSYTFP